MQTNAEPEPISRDVLLDVVLRHAEDTHRIEVRRIRIIPGYAAGLHVHNGPMVGSIVEGPVTFQIEGEPESVPGAGRRVLRAGRCPDHPVRRAS